MILSLKYFRVFGVKCDRCGLVLSPHDLVMRTMSYIYHLGCFQCVMCGQSLQVNIKIHIFTIFQNFEKENKKTFKN